MDYIIIICCMLLFTLVGIAIYFAQTQTQVTINFKQTTTTPEPTTTLEPTTAPPTSTTAAPRSTTVAPTSTTVAPTSTTIAPTSTTAAPTRIEQFGNDNFFAPNYSYYQSAPLTSRTNNF